MKEGDSLVAINALIAEHWMLCYPTRLAVETAELPHAPATGAL
jgi:hypothetical protein